jgi:hypothetical protein
VRLHPRRLAPLLVLLVAGSAATASALDLGLSAWAGNLGFRTDRVATDTTFPGAGYFLGMSLYGSQQITDTIGFETGFYSDQVLRNTSYTLFSYSAKILSVGIGPFFGLFNDPGTLLKSGISTAVRLELPGIAFVSFRSDSSIGGELVEVGDYLQERNDISLGFYVPNAICTVSLNARKFAQRTADATVIDRLTEYAFATDIFRKNVPYRLLVTFAYQSLEKSWVAATTTSATLNSLVIGSQLSVSLSDTVLLQAGMEGTVYSFGTGILLGGASPFLFRAYTGVKVSSDVIPFLDKIL